MHKSWLDQLPYYAARTLPDAEHAALEQHLAGCAECRRALDEWRVIGQAVTGNAIERAASLPPLPALPPQTAPRRRIARLPLAWAASILLALAVGVLAGLRFEPDESSGPHGSVFIQATEAAPEPTTFAPTPTPISIILPSVLQLEGIRHEYQTWNNDGPATLAMAFSHYGIEQAGAVLTQEDIQPVLRPNVEDKSTRPDELVQYVNEHTDLRAIMRIGGDQAVLKRLVAMGFPVIVEQTLSVEELWFGHYVLIMGYDDLSGAFLTYDSFLGHNNLQGRQQPYDTFDDTWQQFNRVFIVVYQPMEERRLQLALGDYTDESYGVQVALEAAQREAEADADDAFAWFSLGSSYIALQDYENAAAAYDKAFQLMLPPHMLWYQFGPYEAYYNAGRYEDVLALALSNLGTTTYVEETYYWQGKAYAALGRVVQAKGSFQQALALNPNYAQAEEALVDLLPGFVATPDATEVPDATEAAAP